MICDLRVASLPRPSVVVVLLCCVAPLSGAIAPYSESGEGVAGYRADFQGVTPKAGWSYLWNPPSGWVAGGASGDGSSNPIGTSSQYAPLLWNGSQWTPDGDATNGNNQPAGFLRCDANGGHPGLGATQAGAVGNALDRYAIAAFTVSRAGTYQVTESLLSRGTSGNTGIDLRVSVGDSEVPGLAVTDYNVTAATAFDGAIGTVQSNDTIYVAVGPHDNAGSDGFALDFALRLAPSNDLTGDQSESDTRIYLVPEKVSVLTSNVVVDQPVSGGESYGPDATPGAHTITAGTAVASHLLHFDPVVAGAATGTYTFDFPVIGLLHSDAKLNATDPLFGNASMTYPSEGGATLSRGSVSEPTDTVAISTDRRTITVRLYAGTGGRVDQLRVLLELPAGADRLIVNPGGEINGGVSGESIAAGGVLGWEGTGGQVLYGRTFAGNGRWRLSMEDSSSIHQLTRHVASTGEAFSLRFDSGSFSGTPPSVTGQLFVEDGAGVRTTVVSRVFAFAPAEPDNWQHFQLLTDHGDLDAHAGKRVGVLFTGPDGGPDKYLSVDGVSLEALASPSMPVSFRSAWTNAYDRRWAGPGFWANRLQDWQVQSGRLECVRQNLPMRTVHLTTARLEEFPGDFSVTVRAGLNAGSADEYSFAGVLLGGGPRLDARSACLIFHQDGQDGGILAGVSGWSRAVCRDMTSSGYPTFASAGGGTAWQGDADVEIDAVFDGVYYDLGITVRKVSDGSLLGYATLDDIEPARMIGNIALVSHKGSSGNAAFWFQGLEAEGRKLGLHPERIVGPILSAQHTLSEGTLKMTAQLQPVAVGQEISSVALQVDTDASWDTVAVSPVEDDAYVALFRVTNWRDSAAVPYRLVADIVGRDGSTNRQYWSGTVAANPEDKDEVVVAGFTGNLNIANAFKGVNNPGTAPVDWTPEFVAFPHVEVCEHVALQAPDILFFSGDQVYEGGSPTPTDTGNLKLDYLYKWYLWCWAYRDLARDIPCIAIPDDHDVYQGNLWGQGGRAASSQTDGGYTRPAWFAQMVEKTQTSNLPDPYDPTPVEQGIGVYYTNVKLGWLGLAVIEDRKFKIGPTSTEGTNGISDDDVMLGDRQLAFLEAWTQDWTNEFMKAVLSQTVFAMTTTHASESLNYRTTDKDSNGWPPAARDRAVDMIRRGYVMMIGGDQHLATVVHHGIDTYDDSGYHFCVPSVLNAFPRVWDPAHPASGTTGTVSPYLGSFQDGFGSYMTFHAVANPASYYNGVTCSGFAPARIHDRAPGYGIVRFRKSDRTIGMECWPRHADPRHPYTGEQYPDWPVTIRQTDNYARAPHAFLPVVGDGSVTNGVVQVVNEADGDILYTLRTRGTHFRPHVFTNGVYRVRFWDPELGTSLVLGNQAPVTGGAHVIHAFEAAPVYVSSNSAVRLSWDVEGSAGLRVVPMGNVASNSYNGIGHVDVELTSNSTYTLVSTNAVGEQLQSQVDVRVFETIEAWRARHFTPVELDDPAVSGDGADPDGDGIVNILEYALTANPRSDSLGRLPELSIVWYEADGAGDLFLTLMYPGIVDVAGVRYEVQYSADLSEWKPLTGFQSTSVGVTDGGPGETPLLTDRDTVSLGAYPQEVMYFRLVLKGP